jgi:hypothetical protein
MTKASHPEHIFSDGEDVSVLLELCQRAHEREQAGDVFFHGETDLHNVCVLVHTQLSGWGLTLEVTGAKTA